MQLRRQWVGIFSISNWLRAFPRKGFEAEVTVRSARGERWIMYRYLVGNLKTFGA